MGFYEDTGILILGTRLKRLSERFLSEVSKIYEELEINFEPAWFPLIFLIYKKGPLTITKISDELKVSQSAVSQLASGLKKKGFIVFVPDKEDKRKKLVDFSSNGSDVVKQLIPVWAVVEKNMLEIICEGKNNSHIIDGFDELEKKLNRVSLSDSVINKLKKDAEGVL